MTDTKALEALAALNTMAESWIASRNLPKPDEELLVEKREQALFAVAAALSSPAVEPVACPAEYQGPFFAYDFMPQKIMFKSDQGDTMALDVLSVRGWGHLTGKGGGLGIDPEVAAKIQDNFGQWVVQTLNAALHPPVTGVSEDIKACLGAHAQADAYDGTLPDDADDAEYLRKQATYWRLKARTFFDYAEYAEVAKARVLDEQENNHVMNALSAHLTDTGAGS